jgi:hypothetical protein
MSKKHSSGPVPRKAYFVLMRDTPESATRRETKGTRQTGCSMVNRTQNADLEDR